MVEIGDNNALQPSEYRSPQQFMWDTYDAEVSSEVRLSGVVEGVSLAKGIVSHQLGRESAPHDATEYQSSQELGMQRGRVGSLLAVRERLEHEIVNLLGSS